MNSLFDREPPPRDVDGKIAAALERLAHAIQSLIRGEAHPLGLSSLQAQILIYCAHAPESRRSVSDIARRFELAPATVSDALRALEQKGLLARERCGADRRLVYPILTERGGALGETLAGWENRVREASARQDESRRLETMLFLMELIADLHREGIVTVARMCVVCRHFQRNIRPGMESPHHCAMLDLPLPLSELRIDCPDYHPLGDPG